MISFEEFAKVDIRMGTVVSAVVPEWSHWVIKLTVDLGPEIGTKTAFSGIMKFFKPEDLIGNQYPFVVNMLPKKIGPDRELSEVMMVMAVEGEGKVPEEEVKPVLFKISEVVENGTIVR